MKTILISGLLILFFLTGCEKVKDNSTKQYSAQIVGFDLNCSTCIVAFPDDSLNINAILGPSPNNYYQIVNLDKGNYTIGQKLKVEVRKAEDAELKACITMYPTNNYINLYALDYQDYTDLRFNDTLVLAYKDCFYDQDGQSYICLDTVLSDSRCPTGAQCIWAGEARARFKIEKLNNSPVYIDLKEGAKDTLVSGYKFSFIKLLPYPSLRYQIKPQEYKAKIVVRNM
jgi:hypothetical protein